MDDLVVGAAGQSAPPRSPDVIAQARRRRLKRILSALLLGFLVWAYTLGALDERVDVGYENDLLPAPIEALVLGAAFVVGSLPAAWSIVGRIVIPVPTFWIYLTVLLGKSPPLPFHAAFATAVVYSAALTALSRYLADWPRRSMLGSRKLGARI
jgi:hypothetical protein